ncbi:MAG TPA: UDP-N-acetylmuramoylalanyl-D-glutamyl-2,6-diaminopimelate--D-alanyl-D-alanine ligase, partial [Stellaceae bacterium]|nr:UDP-N-acetylmuramoylalanyl-D-glutamyl-2,6-diaminopimelate--D-alanyl-D-alanine ligase [Stellaceae bacterium]
MGAACVGPLPDIVAGVSIDSRTIGRGEAFFAIQGDARDGHDFVAAALQSGAGLAVVAKDKRAAFADDAPLLVVPDVLAGLTDLARASRARSGARIVAVTGSVGKTGTKEALRLVLAKSGATHASVASYNNHWGVPLSLARMPPSAHFAVFEIGMNHPGEITPLTRLVRPHVAIVTTVEPVHLEYLGSLDAIADAKGEIFSGLEPGGAAIINRDNSQYQRLRRAAEAAGASVVSFGDHAEAGARLLKVSLHAESSAVHARILGTEVTYKVGAPGRHIVMNSLAVLAAASLVGADLALASLALAALEPPTGRGQRITLSLPGGGSALLIDESYNANPASMRAALALLGQARTGRKGRRIAVLGDMLELGPAGTELHRGLAEPIRAHDIDLVFCAG